MAIAGANSTQLIDIISRSVYLAFDWNSGNVNWTFHFRNECVSELEMAVFLLLEQKWVLMILLISISEVLSQSWLCEIGLSSRWLPLRPNVWNWQPADGCGFHSDTARFPPTVLLAAVVLVLILEYSIKPYPKVFREPLITAGLSVNVPYLLPIWQTGLYRTRPGSTLGRVTPETWTQGATTTTLGVQHWENVERLVDSYQ